MTKTGEPQFINVSIPRTLYKAIEERLEVTEFNSVEAYVAYVLNELVSDEEQLFSEKDEAEVKQRLRDLGYID